MWQVTELTSNNFNEVSLVLFNQVSECFAREVSRITERKAVHECCGAEAAEPEEYSWLLNPIPVHFGT